MKISNELIAKYNQAAPRYTSYPPANFFTEDFNAPDLIQLIEDSNVSNPQNLAFYIHIPFCERICFYCGCNAQRLSQDDNIQAYIDAVKQEIKMVCRRINKDRRISQIHFGGGTPNAIEAHYLKDIIDLLSSEFSFIDRPEIAIECHPGLLTYEYIDELIASGFNRMSLGIQDFDDEVLKTVNRKPANIPVEDIVAYLRDREQPIGVNLDFIYGLPLQTPESFAQSIERAVAISPDRLVTFSYAHVPWVKKHQEILQKKGLPVSEEKMKMFDKASELMTEAGYTSIGFDHFAKPEDELSIALDNKQLYRNFQGYCTKRTTGQVFAFGVSAISQLNGGYIQNTKDINNYKALLAKAQFPLEKGLKASFDETITREVINQIMCNHYVVWPELAKSLKISTEKLKAIVNYDEEKLQDMTKDGLLSFDEETLNVTALGKLLIRNIASLFDPMFKDGEGTYSKTI